MNKSLALSAFALLCVIAGSAQSTEKLHRKAVLVDTHNDVLSSVTMKGVSVEQDLSGRAHSDISRFQKGGVDVQFFSIFCNEKFGKDTAFKFANIEIDSLYAIVNRNPGKLLMARNSADISKAVRSKRIACLIGVEGGHMIEDDLSKLDSLARRGMRYLTLTWNNSTSWATSAADESKGRMPFGTKGLTDMGRQIVRRMNELGVMIDISHTGEQTFYDALAVTTRPVIASHSSVYNLCPHPRNLKDDQIRAMKTNGGVIQLNFYSGFLDSNYLKRKEGFLQAHKTETDSLKSLKLANYEIDDILTQRYPQESAALRPPLTVIFDHIDYIVKLAGIDHVGLGSDFDGIESAPIGLEGVQDFPAITRGLAERGYSKTAIRKILGGNFLRVMKANEKQSIQ